jgi:hypothetical protein
LWLRVECTLFCNLQSRARTHAVLVIGLYISNYLTHWATGPLDLGYVYVWRYKMYLPSDLMEVNCSILIDWLIDSLRTKWMYKGGRRDPSIVEFIITCTVNAHHHYSCEFEPRSWWGVLDTTLCDNVSQWLAAGRWLSPGNPVSSTNKTDRFDITEILLKVALNTMTLTLWM